MDGKTRKYKLLSFFQLYQNQRRFLLKNAKNFFKNFPKLLDQNLIIKDNIISRIIGRIAPVFRRKIITKITKEDI